MAQSAGRDAVLLTSSKIATASVGLVTTMLLSRFRSLTEYGSFSQIQTVVNLAVAMLVLGLPGSVSYFLTRAETTRQKQHFISNYLTFSTLISVFLGLLLVFATPLIERFYGNGYLGTLTFVFALLPWVNITLGGLDNIMIVNHRVRMLMIYKVTYSLLLFAVIPIVEVLRMSFHTYMVLYVVVQVVFAAVGYVLTGLVCGRVRISLDLHLLRHVLGFSVPLGLATVVGTWSTALDKLVIGHLLDTGSLAIYANAAQELPITFVASSMTAVLLPLVVRRAQQSRFREAIDLWGDATVASFYVIGLFVAMSIVAAPQIVSFLYSPKYLPGVPVFRVYSVILLLRVTYFGLILNAVGKTRLILYSSLASLALNVVLCVPLFWLFGLIGPALATLASLAVVNGLQLQFSARHMGIGLREILPWGSLSRVAAINVVLGAAASLALWLLHAGVDWIGMAKTVAVGCCWLLAYVLLVRKRFRVRWAGLNVTD